MNSNKKFQNTIDNKADNTVILYEDEAIVTSEPTITCMWAKKGSRPIVNTDTSKSRERKVIYGSVNPQTGELITQIVDSGNSDNFRSFLK